MAILVFLLRAISATVIVLIQRREVERERERKREEKCSKSATFDGFLVIEIVL